MATWIAHLRVAEKLLEEMDTYVNNTSELIADRLHTGLLAIERKAGK
jgi:hypothetical protein